MRPGFYAAAIFQLLCFSLLCFSGRTVNGQVREIGTIQQPALSEASGLTASRKYPGVYWTHNDTGFPAFLFAINERGEHLGAFEVKGARLIDWEAISAGEDGYLYFADTGTDGMARTHSAVHRAKEPNPYDRWGPAEVVETWYIRYPEGPRVDVEAFFVHNRFAYLIGRQRSANDTVPMYRFSLDDPEEALVLDFVANIPVENEVTDAAISMDGNRLAVLSQDGVEVFFIRGTPASAQRTLVRFTEFENDWAEGITFTPTGILATGEGVFVEAPGQPQQTLVPADVLFFDDAALAGAPEILEDLDDQVAQVGDTVRFAVSAAGFPALTYQWTFNGQIIPGATNFVLTIPNVTLANAGVYEVIVRNAAGEARSSARLIVRGELPDLRVTEVMTDPSGGRPTADFWELTNFEETPVDISGWRFNDGGGDLEDAFVFPEGLIIAPGESLIFVADLTPEQFRAWWGPRLREDVRIITYPGLSLSFSAAGDTLRIWDDLAFDEDDVFAAVELPAAEEGSSFIYNPETGELVVAEPGLFGAFRDAEGIDVGSPGIIDAPDEEVPNLRITEVMSFPVAGTITADFWELTSFAPTAVDLSGWRFNDDSGGFAGGFALPEGLVIQPGETMIFVEELTAEEFRAWWGAENLRPDLRIITYTGTGLSFSQTGDVVNLWTDLGNLVDSAVVPPAVAGRSFVYNPQTGTFGTVAEPGVFGAFEDAEGVNVGSPGVIDTVVAERPDLRVTEVMSLSTTPDTEDYWELTSFDNRAIDLSGWRFNDDTGTPAEGSALPQGLVIQPGETIIFVEDMTPEAFRAWWGANRVPATVRVFTYTGTGLSFSQGGDTLRIWDAQTNLFTQVTIPAAVPGFSFVYNPETGQFGSVAQPGVFGAFVSVSGQDVGSPGVVDAPREERPDLVVTEVMSAPTAGQPTADYWELTSFDDEPVDLSGWRFNDDVGTAGEGLPLPQGLIIQPGETLVFAENLTPEQFRAWWGADKIPETTRIITYVGSGVSFSSLGDALRIWDAQTNLFTQVRIPPATPGASFIWNPETGQFGTVAQEGQFGAFRDAAGLDVGSPGVIDEPPVEVVDVRVTEVMSFSAGQEGEDFWELTNFGRGAVDVSGWMFNDDTGTAAEGYRLPGGIVLQPGETAIFVEDLTADEFRAWWGAGRIPANVRIITYTGMGLSFSQGGDTLRLWDANTNTVSQTVIPAATAGSSFIYNPQTGQFGTVARPGLFGAFSDAAGLNVGSPGVITGPTEERPNLTITEVMSFSTAGQNTEDYWELTSFEAGPVDISGWRFNDDAGTAAEGYVLPQGLIIQPGETIIFVEDMSAEAFRTWWGEARLPAGLRIITYTGTGLSFSQLGDTLRLWDAATNLFTQVTLPAATAGSSFIRNPETGLYVVAQPGLFGAFRDAAGLDIGSPGIIDGTAQTAEFALQAQEGEAALRISFYAEAGHVYTLEKTEAVPAAAWREEGQQLEATDNGMNYFEVQRGTGLEFYRVRKE